MVETVEVKTFKSKFFLGAYNVRKNIILLNERLDEAEKIRVLKHELEHWRFYNRTLLGKLLRPFHYRVEFIEYAVLLVSMWFLSPVLYLIVCVPIFLDNAHEILTSLKYPPKSSLAMALSLNLLFLMLFFIRLRWI